jgi:site-specific recombinase XerD
MSNIKENVNYIPDDKFKLILFYVDKELKSKKIQSIDIIMLFKIAYNGGLRINEVLKLSKQSFNFNLLQINLGKTKTKNHDIATFSNNFSKELQDYFLINRALTLDTDLLFPVSRQTVYSWIMEIGKALEITAWTTPQKESGEKTKSHLFRKKIAKDYLYKNAPLNIIMNKLRHNNLATTSDYLKLNISDVQSWEKDNF